MTAPRSASRTQAARRLLTEQVRDGREQAALQEATARQLSGLADPDSALERDLALACAARAREAVRRAEDALERIELGTYGTCQECGGVIAPERLDAVPDAMCCVQCLAPSAIPRPRGAIAIGRR